MDSKMKFALRGLLVVTGLFLAAGSATPVAADPGDKSGWSVNTDPRRRAFLQWVEGDGGPRVIMLGCLRDAAMFTTMSSAVGERDEIKKVKLTLSNGSAKFSVEGETTQYPAGGRSSFISDLDADDARMRAVGRQLLPVLQGTGDIVLTLEPGTASGMTTTRTISIAGLAAVLGRFQTICFR